MKWVVVAEKGQHEVANKDEVNYTETTPPSYYDLVPNVLAIWYWG